MGLPLYVVNNPDEAKFIINQRQKWKEELEAWNKSIGHIDKKIEKLTWDERKNVYWGDKSALLSKLNIMSKDDIEKLWDELESLKKLPEVSAQYKNFKR